MRSNPDMYVSREERAVLCDTRVTLNGSRARITGTNLDFAMVRQVETGLGAEWSWSTIAFVVANRKGAFHS